MLRACFRQRTMMGAVGVTYEMDMDPKLKKWTVR